MWISEILICFDAGSVLVEVVYWRCVVLVRFMCLEGFDAEVCAFGTFSMERSEIVICFDAGVCVFGSLLLEMCGVG